MSTASSTAPNAGSAAKPRSSGERVVVWGFILLLVCLAGYEFYVKSKFEAAEKAVLDKLADAEKDMKSATHLTDKDIPALLGREKPDFAGHPGQLSMLNSNWYEAYVWKSLLKNKFVMPPEKPEILNMYAIYSGEVRPEKIKYRTPGYDKNIENQGGLFSAHVLYVYYGAKDKGVREVINITRERVPYQDSVQIPPNAEELKKRHDQNLLAAITDREKFGPKLTAKQKEELDSWLHPPADTDFNMRSIPNWDPVTNSYRPGKQDPESSDVEPKKASDPPKSADSPKSGLDAKEDRGGSKKGDSEKSADKPADKPADKKPADEKSKTPGKRDI